MANTNRFLLSTAIIGLAAIAAAAHTQWSKTTDLVILSGLLAALVGAGVLAFRSRATRPKAESRPSSKNVSTSLATLSSAAVLAIYAAGYYRTGSGTGGFGETEARRNPALAIARTVSAPLAPVPPNPTSGLQPAASPATAAKKPKASSSNAERQPTPKPTSAYMAPTPATPLETKSAVSSAPVAVAPQLSQAAPDANSQLAPPPAIAPPAKSKYKDGTFLGWGSCRHGDIQASVTIQDGKIVSSAITQCLTRYSCSWISNLPGQVVTRQSPEVDYVSGATQSTDAFYGAVVDALSKAHN